MSELVKVRPDQGKVDQLEIVEFCHWDDGDVKPRFVVRIIPVQALSGRGGRGLQSLRLTPKFLRSAPQDALLFSTRSHP